MNDGSSGLRAVLGGRHLDLLGGRPGAGRIEDRPHWVGDADAFAGHDFRRREGLRRRVQGHPLTPPDTTVIAIDEEMHAVRDHIREFVKVQRALVGDDGSLGPDGKPLRTHVLLRGTRIAAQPVQAATDVLVSPGANVVCEQLRTEASFAPGGR